MNVTYRIIESEVKTIYYNGEPVEKELFKPGKEYHQEFYTSTLSQTGIQQIGKLIKEFQIYVDTAGWFTCECY